MPTQQRRDLELRGICRSFPILLPAVILTASACHTISHQRRRKYWPQNMYLISFLRSPWNCSRVVCLSVRVSALGSDLWRHFCSLLHSLSTSATKQFLSVAVELVFLSGETFFPLSLSLSLPPCSSIAFIRNHRAGARIRR